MNGFCRFLSGLTLGLMFFIIGCKKDVDIEPVCGPFEPNEEWKTPESDPKYYDTVFYAFQENLNLSQVECYEHDSGYEIIEGNNTVFKYYFFYRSESYEDIRYERTFVFEAPQVIKDTYYIDNEGFCDHNVYLKGEAAFGVINDELMKGPGCISVESMEDNDAYKVNVNLPIIWHNDSTSQLQFTELFTRTSDLI